MKGLGSSLLSESTESATAAGVVASTAGDLVVDLAVGKLVDLVVVLVAKASTVGQVVDLCKVAMLTCALRRYMTVTTYECEPVQTRPSQCWTAAVRPRCDRCHYCRSCPGHPWLCSKGWTCLLLVAKWVFVCFDVTRIGWRGAKATRRQDRAMLYALLELRLRVCCLRDSLITLATSLQRCELPPICYWVCVVTVGPATSTFLVGKLDVAGGLEGQVRLCLASARWCNQSPGISLDLRDRCCSVGSNVHDGMTLA